MGPLLAAGPQVLPDKRRGGQADGQGGEKGEAWPLVNAAARLEKAAPGAITRELPNKSRNIQGFVEDRDGFHAATPLVEARWKRSRRNPVSGDFTAKYVLAKVTFGQAFEAIVGTQ